MGDDQEELHMSWREFGFFFRRPGRLSDSGGFLMQCDEKRMMMGK